MSDSLSVFTMAPTPINIANLIGGANSTLGLLLNQSENFSFDLEIAGDGEKNKLFLGHSEKIHRLIERKYCSGGVLFSYSLDDCWELHSRSPLYEFCVMELPRRNDNILLALCISFVISAANLLSEKNIVDTHGILSQDSDVISIDTLLELRIDVPLPLNEALSKFYEKLPAFRT